MMVWVDGDSCPKQVRELVNSRCLNEKVSLCYVANRPVALPDADGISMILTSGEEGSADAYITEHAGTEDLVITRDIPLASELVNSGRTVINDRGTRFSASDIKERLAERDFMQMMREAGLEQDRGRNYGAKELKKFADCFDREFTRLVREERFRKLRKS